MKRTRTLALAFTCVAAIAQQPGEIQLQAKLFLPGFHFTSSSPLVEVPVVVTDSAGNAVAGLRASDFTLFDNGQPQTVTFFSQESSPATLAAYGAPAPAGTAAVAAPRPSRSIALLFDDLDTRPASLGWCRQAALRYVEQDQVGEDRFAVLTTSEQVEQTFTSDRAVLARAIAKVRGFTEPVNDDDPDMLPELRMKPEMLELFAVHTISGIRDAVAYAAAQPGERQLLLASNGFKSSAAVNSMVAALTALAVRDQVVVNTLFATGLDNTDPRGGHINPRHLQLNSSFSNVLFTMARDTGGSMVENTNITASTYQRLADGPAVRYRLGFVPSVLGSRGAYHQLSVKLARPHVAVQARVGYYEPAAASVAAGALEAKLDRALAGGSFSELPIALAVEPMAQAQGTARGRGTGVNAVVRLMPAELPFGSEHGRSTEELRYYAVLRDGAGRYVSGQEGDMSLALSPQTRTELAAKGVYAALALPAPPGTYHLWVVVQELNQARTATLRRAVTVK